MGMKILDVTLKLSNSGLCLQTDFPGGHHLVSGDEEPSKLTWKRLENAFFS